MNHSLSNRLIALAQYFREIACTELLPRHGKLHDNQIKQHSDGSLFTEADLIAEKRLVEAAAIIYPDVVATGEEEISEDPSSFFEKAITKTVLIFDPIDGTGAFKRGEDTYGMMGALITNNEVVGSIIYTPGHAVYNDKGNYTAEKDILIVAEKNKGCWLFEKGKGDKPDRIDLSGRATSLKNNARVAFACRNQDASHEPVLAKGVPGYRERNNSSWDYTLILTGKMDATFYSEGHTPKGFGKCSPWDHAAGALAVQEAGGCVALPYKEAGKSYTPLYCHDRLLVAANQSLFLNILGHVRKRAPHLTAPRLG